MTQFQHSVMFSNYAALSISLCNTISLAQNIIAGVLYHHIFSALTVSNSVKALTVKIGKLIDRTIH